MSNSDNFPERKVQVYKNFCVSISQKQCAKFAFGSLAQRRANFVNVSRKVKLQAEWVNRGIEMTSRRLALTCLYARLLIPLFLSPSLLANTSPLTLQYPCQLLCLSFLLILRLPLIPTRFSLFSSLPNLGVISVKRQDYDNFELAHSNQPFRAVARCWELIGGLAGKAERKAKSN